MSSMKRGSDGSAFIRCDSCNKSVPAATADMHECQQDQKTNLVLDKVPTAAHASDRRPLKDKNAATLEKDLRKAGPQKSKKARKSPKLKDIDRPKRPPTAFFLFMEEFRKSFKEQNPESKGVGEVAKSAAEKWKAMSDEEKSSFLKRAAGLKETYEISLKAFMASKKMETNGENLQERRDENDDPCRR
ncbi:hypothetical protein GOP47_0000205 [Adiantum capillus-veneris]|uniref:HMG box domain-containing protein n=1 Tax=Adiantum capillus-veneris TaxID=13818 RepID=A0A9D4VEB0_ADICA|nr:hypothetical protein GOP47_0000205 [Adiantum capillus-veneris]